MTLKVINRPVWHYIALLFLVIVSVFSVIDLIIYLIIRSFIDISYSVIFLYSAIFILSIFIMVSYFLWTHYVRVKPSAIKLYEWNDGPWLHYGGNPKQNIIINWITKNQEKTEILFGKNRENLKKITGVNGKIHRILIDELIPGETYYYQILNFPKDAKIHSFTSAPDNYNPFSFIVLGDTQNGGGFGCENWAYPYLINQIQKQKFQLLMNLGDACDQGNDIKSWHRFLEETSKIASEHPIHIAIGNHDTGTQFLHDKTIKKYPDEGANFDYLLGYNYAAPQNENRITSFKGRYYSFDYSNCRFLFLDSQNSKLAQINNPQWQFIEEKLKNCPKDMWKIIFIHRTLFERKITSNGNEELVKTKYGNILVPLFEKYNVDIVFSGHAHNFQFIERKSRENRKIYYIVAGGGGNELRRNPPIDISENLSLEYKYFENSSHFVKIDVNNDKIQMKVFYEDGNLMNNQSYEFFLH